MAESAEPGPEVLAERLAAELVLERLVVAPEQLVPVRPALLARLASWSGRSH